MLQPGQKPPTAAELEEAGYALLEQLASRDALRFYQPLLQAVAPALREAGAELARQSEGKLAPVQEREAIAQLAGHAVRQALLALLQVPEQFPRDQQFTRMKHEEGETE